MTTTMTVAEALAQAMEEAGVQRIYGVPGGGSSLDVIEAAARRGIAFTLTKTENAAVMMAGALAESTGRLGVALMTKGPGVANAANGVAYASLDRAPVMVITDGFTPAQLGYITHQVFDQRAMLAPVVKGHGRLDGDDAGAEIRRLVTLACTAPCGPVHLELTSAVARKPLGRTLPEAARTPPAVADAMLLKQAAAMIAKARRPVIVAGLEARRAAPQLRALAEGLCCPVLSTYKAKGVLSDRHELVTGVFTGGAQEQECVHQADLIVLVGMDPVELILQPWPYDIPVLDIGVHGYSVHYVKPALGVYGSLAANLEALGGHGLAASTWEPGEIARLRSNVQRALAYGPVSQGVAPDRLVQLTAEACAEAGLRPRMSVDAGAHMFSATTFFPCEEPGDCLISNGLASMAFGVPAAIAAAIEDPTRPVVCFTGDGGLMMCMGELCTAVEAGARILVVVFNDGALSLIDVKQQSRQLPTRGVRWGRHDFARVMEGAGGAGWRVRDEDGLRTALQAALAGQGPALIDVEVEAAGYAQQLKAMRG
ncbi:Acetolactate synthase isozyme 3 large subunit [Variovorax sp. PBL-H6]|uniref:thiamine pyrophosphate-binding protein n=1 Tax=Variovorax sp. PBL-H6 TaxID=434009 RepID=UPI0013179C5C|nr:thiamine pyrophosphate-binding protein [Variovorax sp. PBL-H6]VTU25627.1 Acetolactate synthase isozyme 3 large subunit [Variovorax sp. PBL-H6]